MARPRKNNAEYFSHDATLRNDIKIKALRSNFGSDGYASYCILLEILTDADNFRVPNSDLQRTLMAWDIGIAEKTFDEILDLMTRLELVQQNDEWIWINHLLERMEPVLRKRRAMQDAYHDRIEEPQKEPEVPAAPPAGEKPPKEPKPKREKKYLWEKEWAIFHERYPKKEHMHKAKEKFYKIDASEWPAILDGLTKWEGSDKWVRGFKHNATTWINWHLWADKPDPYNWNPTTKNEPRKQPTTRKTGYSDTQV